MVAKTQPTTWQALHDAKKAEQNSRIPEAWKLKKFPAEDTRDLRSVVANCGILTERELEITGDHYDATSLAIAIAAGSFTSVEVVTAFCKRAAIGHQVCNMLTEIMFEDALKQAERLDEIFHTEGKVIGPLHGVPM